MCDLLKAIAEATYNGICLAAENGTITEFTAGHVSPPEEFTDGITRIMVQLPDRRVVCLGVFQDNL